MRTVPGNDREQTLVGRGPECVNCHRDPHFGSLGPTCNDCHTQSYFCQVPSCTIRRGSAYQVRIDLSNVASVIQIESKGAYLINATSATQTPSPRRQAHQRVNILFVCRAGAMDATIATRLKVGSLHG